MSDGSLSQDEIDALLMDDGMDPIPDSSILSMDQMEESAAGEPSIQLFSDLFQNEISDVFGNTMSGVLSKKVVVEGVQVVEMGGGNVRSLIPDEFVSINIAYTSGVSGGHFFLIDNEKALSIASQMMGQEGLELNDTTLSALSEAMGQITGAITTRIGEKINDTILSNPPEASLVASGTLQLKGDQFVSAIYGVQIEGQEKFNIYEVFDSQVAMGIASKLNKNLQEAAASVSNPSNAGGDQEGGLDGFQQMSQNMGGSMMGSFNQPTPNVHGVQLSTLSAPSLSNDEQRNISLLMDVSMELTVELGRTKWKIKDILGIGEGTIVELDKLAGEPVDILVNNNLIARGEVVVIDENFGVRVTEIVSALDRLNER